MARPSVVPEILALLEPFLEARLSAWDAADPNARVPTLPATPDGKVSVDGLVRELGCNPNWNQHFFKKREVMDAVNLAAETMGLSPIGSRAFDEEAGADAEAEAMRTRMAKLGSSEKKASEDLIDALRRIDLLTAENEGLRLEVERLEASLAAIFETGDRPFHDPFGNL